MDGDNPFRVTGTYDPQSRHVGVGHSKAEGTPCCPPYLMTHCCVAQKPWSTNTHGQQHAQPLHLGHLDLELPMIPVSPPVPSSPAFVEVVRYPRASRSEREDVVALTTCPTENQLDCLCAVGAYTAVISRDSSCSMYDEGFKTRRGTCTYWHYHRASETSPQYGLLGRGRRVHFPNEPTQNRR